MFRSTEALVRALEDLGFARESIEVHARAVALEGFEGNARAQDAEIVVRRRHVGPGSNDLGFARQADGTFRAIVSAYDQRARGLHGPYDAAWIGRLTQAYGVRHMEALYRAQGRHVSIEQRGDVRRLTVEW